MSGNVKNITFYVEPDVDVDKAKSNEVFLVYENNADMKVGFAPTYGHFSFSNDGLENLSKCTKISVDQYKELSKGYDTPKIYLVGEKMSISNQWERKDYVVESADFDHNLKVFNVIQNDEIIGTIYPHTVEDMNEIIKDLDNGADVEGWENGMGETIHIPEPENLKKNQTKKADMER